MVTSVSPLNRPADVNIGNWREYPQSQWSFQFVRELIPTAVIAAANPIGSTAGDGLSDLEHMTVKSPTGSCEFVELLQQSQTNGLLVLHRGMPVAQWNAPYFDPVNPHILFSISKSVTAMLAGILQSQGLIDFEAPVQGYLPGVKDCVYQDCRVRHLLDMSVALDFEENYTDPRSEYMQYRVVAGWNPVDQNSPSFALEEFLYSLKKSKDNHGHAFLYRSPNSDLLGLLLERVGGKPLATLLSEHLWQPMGASSDGYITVDPKGLGRGAGGICITLDDLARIGQLFLDNGKVNDRQVISAEWIEDTCNNGDQSAWDRGNYKHKLPNGNYRNKWYQIGDQDKSMCARGIHGQLLYINPARSVVIAKLASQPAPLNDDMTTCMLMAFDKIATQYS